MNPNRVSIKLVVFSDGTVRKTCICISFTKNKFTTEYIPNKYNYRA